MLFSRRQIQAASLGVSIAEHSILHPKYRVVVQVRDGVVDDNALFQQTFPVRQGAGRSHLFIPLAGRTRVRTPGGDEVLGVGECMTELRERGTILRRDEASVLLILEWEPGLLGTRLSTPSSPSRVDPLLVTRLRRAVQPLLADEVELGKAAQSTSGIISLLRAEGFPFDGVEPGDLIEPTAPALHSLMQAVDRSVSVLSRRPMVVDLEASLGWSGRQIQRRLVEFHERFAFNATGGWRDLLHRWRLFAGASLMSARGATTESVAELLGYATPTSFCHAFANAGLPSPGAIRERLRELR